MHFLPEKNGKLVVLIDQVQKIKILYCLTLKLSGVPMDLNLKFRASAQKCRIFCRCRFLTFTSLPPRIFLHKM